MIYRREREREREKEKKRGLLRKYLELNRLMFPAYNNNNKGRVYSV